LIEIRKEIDAAAKPKVKSYRQRLARCRAEVRAQASLSCVGRNSFWQEKHLPSREIPEKS
jgi:hypothetical protein